MFRPYEFMIQSLRLLVGKRHNLSCAIGKSLIHAVSPNRSSWQDFLLFQLSNLNSAAQWSFRSKMYHAKNPKIPHITQNHKVKNPFTPLETCLLSSNGAQPDTNTNPAKNTKPAKTLCSLCLLWLYFLCRCLSAVALAKEDVFVAQIKHPIFSNLSKC